jgi:hypothetical protein
MFQEEYDVVLWVLVTQVPEAAANLGSKTL